MCFIQLNLNMKKIKIIDYYSIKTFHEVINFSLLMICSKIFDKTTYVSGKSAQMNIKKMHELYNSNSIKYETAYTFETDSSWAARMRDIWGVITTLYYYFITSYNTLIFYNYTNKISLPIILILNSLLRKKIIFVFHGELEFLTGNVSYLKTSGWYKYSMDLSFKYLFKLSPAYILVLGDSIKSNLLKRYPHINNKILSICHPYFTDTQFSSKAVRSRPSTNTTVKIGTIGIMKQEKGLSSLITLSSKLKDLIKEKKIELYHIGKVYTDKKEYLVNEIYWIGNAIGLDREEFDKHIQQLDYLLFLYPTNSYKLTASGAIMDAVKLRKPIISLHNDYFDYLMGKAPIGYMGNTLDELEQIIRKVVNRELNNNFNQEFDLLSQKISIVNNTILFEKELENFLGHGFFS